MLVTSCNRLLGEHPFHVAGQKYVDAVRLAGALPLIAPPLSSHELGALLNQVDGVLLTGSPSNVHPSHYGQAVHDESLPLDPERDAWTLPLIRQALNQGLPLLAICRGTQELNVSLGGTLFQAVQEAPGHLDHRAGPGTPEQQYAPAHAVQLQPGGLLARILRHGTDPVLNAQLDAAVDEQGRFQVNSLHGQGARALAPGLQIEALAPDGVIEAFSMPTAPGFNLCLQWHPEWQAADNAVSRCIFAAFGDAVRRWRHQRLALQGVG